jgi:hypothetical protein
MYPTHSLEPRRSCDSVPSSFIQNYQTIFSHEMCLCCPQRNIQITGSCPHFFFNFLFIVLEFQAGNRVSSPHRGVRWDWNYKDVLHPPRRVSNTSPGRFRRFSMPWKQLSCWPGPCCYVLSAPIRVPWLYHLASSAHSRDTQSKVDGVYQKQDALGLIPDWPYSCCVSDVNIVWCDPMAPAVRPPCFQDDSVNQAILGRRTK